MSIFTGIIVYLLIFSVTLFTILPFGNEPDEHKAPENMGGAPKNPRIKQKFIATAIVSVVLWGIVFALIQMDMIDFYAIARHMTEEDYGS